jgi:hypothetical protein
MRTRVFLACSALAAFLGAGISLAAEPATGTLSVEHGRGAVMLDLRGSVLGRLAAGTLRVTDQTPNDRFAALVVGRKVTQERLGPRVVVYRGVGLRFRMLGGAYRVNVRGVGIDLSAVGRGVVVLDGEPREPEDDVGLYSFDGVDCGVEPLLCLPLPLDPTRFPLGSKDENAIPGAAAR